MPWVEVVRYLKAVAARSGRQLPGCCDGAPIARQALGMGAALGALTHFMHLDTLCTLTLYAPWNFMHPD